MKPTAALVASISLLSAAAGASAQTAGSIAGTVTDARTGAPLASSVSGYVSVSLFDASGRFLIGAQTQSDGTYTLAPVAGGTYYLKAIAPNHVAGLYQNINCLTTDCRPVDGTPVTLAAGASLTGIDFPLDPGGSIAGTITRAGTGVPLAASAEIYTAAGISLGNAYTDTNGTYVMATLPTGDYYVRAVAASYVSQVYAGVACPRSELLGCRVTTGTAVHVTSGAVTSGIDVALVPTGSISGTVAAPPATAVSVETIVRGTVVTSTIVASDGSYTLSSLAPGAYLVRARGLTTTAAYYDQTCPACGGPVPVMVTAGANTPGINLSVGTGSTITGTITHDLSDWSHGGGGSVAAYDSLGRFVTFMTVTSGTVRSLTYSLTGLTAGTYYVAYQSQASLFYNVWGYSSGALVEQIYGFGDCVAVDCDPTNGTPIHVASNTTVGGIDFTLHSGAEILNVKIGDDVYDARGVRIGPRRFTGPPPYLIPETQRVRGLPRGTYYVRRPGGLLHDTLVCLDCAGTEGTAIVVGGSTSATLVSGPRQISGTVAVSGSGAPLSNVTVSAYSASGTREGSATSDMIGRYEIAGLAPGSYFVKTTNDRNFVDRAYGASTCIGCDPRGAAAVDVTSGDRSGIDFALEPAALIAGVVDAGPFASSDGIGVSLFDPAGALAARVTTANRGAFAAQVPAGTYYVRADPAEGTRSMLFNTGGCPLGNCDPRNGTPVTVTTASPRTNINFDVQSCGGLQVLPRSLASAVASLPYRQVFTRTGDVQQTRYTVTSGLLPLGLTLDPGTGVLSGTPSTSGSSTFSVTAIGSVADCGSTRSYTLHVARCAFTLSPSSATLPAAGGSVAVTLTNTCGSLSTTSLASWLHVSGDANAGSLSVTVDPTSSTAARSGSIVVGRRVFAVRQAGLAVSVPFGSFDTPGDGQQVSGSVGITGWALDDVEVTRVRIVRDPVGSEIGGVQVFIGDAVFIAGARGDVARLYPSMPFSERAGWGYLMLTNMLPNQGNGLFRIYAYADDAEGNTTLLGARTIVCVNNTATAPFGAIDTPGQGETINGRSYVNFGWALTPAAGGIPADGSTIEVLIDGVSVGSPAYGFFRADVAQLFPGLANSNGAIGYQVIDTTSLANGVHTISWLVTDSAGATSGIGSRFFTVNNSADAFRARIP